MNTNFRRKEGEMGRVWGDTFHVACVRERKLRSTISSWNSLESWAGCPWLRCQEQWCPNGRRRCPKNLTAQEAAVGGTCSQPGEGSAASLGQVDNALGMAFFSPEVAGKMWEKFSRHLWGQGVRSSKCSYCTAWLSSHVVFSDSLW